MGGEVLYRAATPADVPFILDSWMKSWRKSPWAGTLPNNRFFAITRESIEQLIARGSTFEVASSHTKPDHILGWICHELTTDSEPRTVIHYLYVKDPYLKSNIARTLVDRAPGRQPGYYTHRYRQVQDNCSYEEGWRHAPEIARRNRREESLFSDVQRANSGGRDGRGEASD
jgi:hypothetical protein